MKKVLIYIFLGSALFQSACTKEFAEINTDPNQTSADVFNPNYLLSQSEYEASQSGYTQLLFQSMWPQVLASTFSYYGNGDKYVASGSFDAYKGRTWSEQYRAASLAFEMQNLTRDKENYTNLYNIGTIVKIVCLSKVTDCYGDVPYSEALRGKEGISAPKYDAQQDIYNSMLSELETAINGLDASKDVPSADVIYGGDITKWKKFGYSLMLKLAMRLTKVDPATAQSWAEKAAAGGTFTSIDDNAKVKCDNSTGYGNNTTGALRVPDDYREVRWSKTFIDYLNETEDPRVGVVTEVAQAGLANNSNQDLAGDRTPGIQIGLPNGYDLNGGATDIRSYAGYPGSTGSGDDIAPDGKYSRPTTSIYLDRSGANFILTYAETELLLAEAKVRGWNVGSTTAAEHYQNGVTAAIASLAQFNSAAAGDAAIAAAVAAVPAFIAANPLSGTTETALEQINTQYWVATGTLFNFIETWCNWRRSGYPVLTPVVYPNGFSNGTIPRRIPYNVSEPSTNGANYAAAVANLAGGDTFTSRVWWDK
ncbi:SusD/RagB family nutrient-binding outer membrane lipoprotein [Panacibacter ginsenosidivorans]|uniref:SusD/RagB family nutrient-binding outer membrane lipoprotein n=1 Tax=Panacibacter ginsenosidivorans TaxID=1813871 RepID=A0A5B8V7U6_9BACT|nr:SusD/RagB family nutrient-binding outer membrane lipoprotein [Panacibacter ginsenosidivorans]QEC67309.1 SusD/RagB family nutrient-binding outer membrane lipoprotein [Panacibacter ginsenosidivorans]